VDLVALPLHELTGTAKTSAGPIPNGTIRAYATCADYHAGLTKSIGSSGIMNGYYSLDLPVGTYRIFLMGPSRSWHDAKATCEEATEVTVTGPRIIDLIGIAPLTVTGTVSSANGVVTSASVWFYQSCQDLRPNNNDYAMAGGLLEGGTYKAMLPAGTYRVRIDVFNGQNAKGSWHAARATCEEATELVITQSGTHDLTVTAESTLSGTVSDKAGPVQNGWVFLFNECTAEAIAFTQIQWGKYQLVVPNGTYRIQIRPNNAYESWHSARPTCATATAVTVAGSVALDLKAMAPVQTVERPPKRIKRGKRIRLAKTTDREVALTWKSATRKICTVRKNTLTGRKIGLCKISAQSEPHIGLTQYTRTFRIRVVRS
jgi:hypothetical protein